MPLSTQIQTHSQPVSAPEHPSNALLARLPRDLQQRLLANATRVPLRKEDLLCEPGTRSGWTYLPCSGVVSLQTMFEDGESVEVAMIGNEGLVGLPFADPETVAQHTAVVLIQGEALRARTDAVQAEFERNPALQRALLHYWHALMVDVAQGSACHRFHSARQRLARWLLAASDRTRTSRIDMTQERLAAALGTQRTGVTAASVFLQDAGAIRSRHGRIVIIDRQRTEAIACECYQLTRTAPTG